MNLTQEQIQAASVAGMKLLASEETRVPGNLVVGGEIQVLYFLLRAISGGQLVVAPPTPPKTPRKREKKDAAKQSVE